MAEMEEHSLYQIRRMREEDIPQVLEIDLDAFPTQWPHPTVSSYHHELRNKLAHYVVLSRGNALQDRRHGQFAPIVAAMSSLKRALARTRVFGNGRSGSSEFLVGMAGIWMMVDEAHVVTIAVRKAHTRSGLGEMLLLSTIDLSVRLGARMITLEVRVSNTVAQALYSKYGFSTAGTRRKYYSDNGEDALIMSTDNVVTDNFRQRLERLRAEHHRRWNRYYI
jgi:[ribosomal protein S18]-alanine N-acetyltransferase